MTAPRLDVQNPLPPEGEQPLTYSELLDKLGCNCIGGATFKPSSLPSATINLGDIIADQTRILSTFTSMYGVVTVILKMISCIIDVICAIPNPFSLIFAVIRLFRSCLPDLISIFPQIAIPAIIICILKILLAILEYITEIIIPLIEDIIQNIEDLKTAINKGNSDAVNAISFKIVALFKEIFNVTGILTALNPIFSMIQALLGAGIGIPCGGSGGSCAGCGDGSSQDLEGYPSDDPSRLFAAGNQCPEILQNYSYDIFGKMNVVFGENSYDWNMIFTPYENVDKIIQLRDFFPKGLDYSRIDRESEIPYIFEAFGTATYSLSKVDSDGKMYLEPFYPEVKSDGYLSKQYGPSSSPSTLGSGYVRLGVDTQDAFSNVVVGSNYIKISETRENNLINSGTWKIYSKLDNQNVILKRDNDDFDGYNILDPNNHIYWRINPIYYTGTFTNTLKINHSELIRHNIIGVGCHPEVKLQVQALGNRFYDIENAVGPNLGLPDTISLPDINNVIENVNSCLTNVVPLNVDDNYILNNYNNIQNDIGDMAVCITEQLDDFKNNISEYMQNLFPLVFDTEKTAESFDAQPREQLVGNYVNISLIAYNRYGDELNKGLPSGIVNVEIFSSDGEISNTVEVLDNNGNPTGEFTATLKSNFPKTIYIHAEVVNRDVSDFNGLNLITKEIEIKFVDKLERKQRDVGESIEPLGNVE